MSQHFLLSVRARTLSLGVVLRMSDLEAEAVFRAVRWPATNGAPVCPHCECTIAYQCRRPSGALRFRCKACRKDFSVTSGTVFAFHKLDLRDYLAAGLTFTTTSVCAKRWDSGPRATCSWHRQPVGMWITQAR